MEADNRPKLLYPSMVIAAITVTVFSLLGIASLTGMLPIAHSETVDTPYPAAALTAGDTPPAESKTAAEPRVAERGSRKPVVAAACRNCGTVESVRLVEVKGEGTGLGAVAGGVAGALLGNGMGRGNGRTAMTVIGGAGGAYVGNEIEKNTRKSTSYRIRVRMEDGSVRTLYQREAPGVAAGDRVRIVDGVAVQRS